MVDINELAGHFANHALTIHGVFHSVLPPESTFFPYTAKRPIPSSGFLFVLRGSGTFVFNETAYELHAGMILHGVKDMSLTMLTKESELEYILVRYTISYMLQVADSSQNPLDEPSLHSHFVIKSGIGPYLTELLHQLHASFYTPGNMSLLRSHYLFQSVLYEAFTSSLNSKSDRNKEIVDQVKAYIQTHYMHALSLRKLADQQGITSKSLSYLFHKMTGISPIQYVIQYRMKRAEELLTTSSFTIKQVATSVGYDDALYFSRLYKKHFGFAPSESLKISK